MDSQNKNIRLTIKECTSITRIMIIITFVLGLLVGYFFFGI